MAWIFLAESEDSQSRSANGCDQLPIVMAHKNLWPTQLASDWKRVSGSIEGHQREMARRSNPSLATRVGVMGGGQLNPTWVEWLMGYPCGHTELKDWATRWFLSVRGKRLKDCQGLGAKK